MVALAIGLAVVGALIGAWLVSFAERPPLRRDGADHRGRHPGTQRDAPAGGAGRVQPAARRRRRRQPGAACVSRGVRLRGGRLRRPAGGHRRPANCRPTDPDQATPDAIEVAYEGSVLPAPASNGILGGAGGKQPLDCVGNSFPKTHDDATGDDYWLNDSKFYVADGSLLVPRPGQRRGRGAWCRTSRPCRSPTAWPRRRRARRARARSSTTTSRRLPARRCGPTWCRSTCACRCAAPPRCSTAAVAHAGRLGRLPQRAPHVHRRLPAPHLLHHRRAAEQAAVTVRRALALPRARAPSCPRCGRAGGAREASR